MVEKFNQFFASVFIVENVGNAPLPPTISGRDSEELNQIEVTEDEVLDLLVKLKTFVSRS